MALIYELNNGRKSGTLPVIVPFNIIHLLSPLPSLSSFEFKGLWQKIQANQSPFPISGYFIKHFNLDLLRASNMTKLKQILCLNNAGFTQVQEVETQPNIVCFAAQLSRPELQMKAQGPNQQADMVTWLMMKLTLTKDGSNCSLQVASCKDIHQISQTVIETVVNLIGKPS